jgi:hypothetical protein
MPIVLELEHKGLLNEVTSSLLKTLILEENVEIQRVLDAYSGLNDRELSFKLIRLAQQQVNYHERPQSPLPIRKHKLMNYVNSLAEYYFRDPNDVKLLQKLIQEEDVFIMPIFEVFESDRDHENLIDSLQRILTKRKAQGLNLNSVTAHAFYNDPYAFAWQRRQGEAVSHTNPRPQMSH